MGALTHSSLDRAVIARYFSFLVISQLVIFTLIGVIFSAWKSHFLSDEHPNNGFRSPDSVRQIVIQIGSKKSFHDIIENLHSKSVVNCYRVGLS